MKAYRKDQLPRAGGRGFNSYRLLELYFKKISLEFLLYCSTLIK